MPERLPLSARKKERCNTAKRQRTKVLTLVLETQVVSCSFSTYACITTDHVNEHFVEEFLSIVLFA